MRFLMLVLCAAAWLGTSLAGSAGAGPYYANSYALVVGIDDYRGSGWPRLGYARRDAEAVAALLRGQGFQVTALYDAQATKTAIVSALQTRLAPRLEPDDRVLVFFAGHGDTEHLGGQDFGYLVPYDATDDSATYLSMEELRTLSEKMGRAKHQLFILNACYGGLFGLRGQVLRVDSGVSGYLQEITRRAAREFITAGGRDQQVLDGGPGGLSFLTYYLLEALGDRHLADSDGDGAMTFPELAGYLLPRATNAYQTPVAGALPGHGGGEFVFFTDAAAAGQQAAGAVDTQTIGDETDQLSAADARSPAEPSAVDGAGHWLGQHLWEIFSGIGTAAVVGGVGWLRSRRRRGRTGTATAAAIEPRTCAPPGTERTPSGDHKLQNVTQHTGDRGVQIGGNAANNIIVTGDGNRVRTGGKGTS